MSPDFFFQTRSSPVEQNQLTNIFTASWDVTKSGWNMHLHLVKRRNHFWPIDAFCALSKHIRTQLDFTALPYSLNKTRAPHDTAPPARHCTMPHRPAPRPAISNDFSFTELISLHCAKQKWADDRTSRSFLNEFIQLFIRSCCWKQ